MKRSCLTCAVWMHPSPTPSCTFVLRVSVFSPSLLASSIFRAVSLTFSRHLCESTCVAAEDPAVLMAFLSLFLAKRVKLKMVSVTQWKKAMGERVRNRETSVQKKRRKQLLAAREGDERQLESRSCDLWLRKGARAGGELRSRACGDSLARLCVRVWMCKVVSYSIILNLTWILFTCVANYNICNIVRKQKTWSFFFESSLWARKTDAVYVREFWGGLTLHPQSDRSSIASARSVTTNPVLQPWGIIMMEWWCWEESRAD